jgi:hypothetical protein
VVNVIGGRACHIVPADSGLARTRHRRDACGSTRCGRRGISSTASSASRKNERNTYETQHEMFSPTRHGFLLPCEIVTPARTSIYRHYSLISLFLIGDGDQAFPAMETGIMKKIFKRGTNIKRSNKEIQIFTFLTIQAIRDRLIEIFTKINTFLLYTNLILKL